MAELNGTDFSITASSSFNSLTEYILVPYVVSNPNGITFYDPAYTLSNIQNVVAPGTFSGGGCIMASSNTTFKVTFTSAVRIKRIAICTGQFNGNSNIPTTLKIATDNALSNILYTSPTLAYGLNTLTFNPLSSQSELYVNLSNGTSTTSFMYLLFYY